jgi:hypothetical protein
VFSFAFIAILVVAIFVFDIGKRWWNENEWRRRWRRRESDED